jgi:peptidoglycan hydrolase CwlO-like protein
MQKISSVVVFVSPEEKEGSKYMKKRFTTLMILSLLTAVMISPANAASNSINHRLNDFESDSDNDALDEIRSFQKHYTWKSKSRIKKAEKKNSKNSRKVRKMQKTVKKTEGAIESYSEDKDRYYAKIKESQAEMIEIESRREANKIKMEAIKERLRRADNIDDLKDAQEEIMDMQKDALAENKANVKGKLNSITKLKKLKKKKSTNSAEKEKIDETIDEYLKSINALEGMQDGHNDDIAASKREIKRLDKHDDDLNWFEENGQRSKLNGLDNLDSTAIKNKKAAENDIDDLRADIESANVSHTAATNRLSTEQDKLRGLKETLNDSQSDLDDMKRNVKLESIDYAIDKIMNDADSAEEKTQFLLTDLDSIRNKLGVDENSRKYADDKLREELAKLDNTPLGMYVQQKIAEAGGALTAPTASKSDDPCADYKFCRDQGLAISDSNVEKDQVVTDSGGDTQTGTVVIETGNGPRAPQNPPRPEKKRIRSQGTVKSIPAPLELNITN